MKYFRCVCGQRFALHQVVAGQNIECPVCQSLVKIPSREEVLKYLANRQKVAAGAIRAGAEPKLAISRHRGAEQASKTTLPGRGTDGKQALTETVTSELPKTNPEQKASLQDQDVEFQAGTLLAQRYRVIAHIGRGGMSDVYSAKDEQTKLAVAVKVLRRELRQDTNSLMRFAQEASLQKDLLHENITRVYAYVSRGGTPMLAMELLKGDTLRAFMERRLRAGRKFEPAEVLRVMHQLVAAISLIHDRGCMHRDIKPENIWYSTDGTVKLMDFGVARKSDGQHLTPISGVVGSAYYMAPEQLEGCGETTQSADQFSLAVVLYEMLSGSIPIGAIKDLSKENTRIPVALSRSILKALSPRPEDRFPTIEAFTRAATGLEISPVFVNKRKAMLTIAFAGLVSLLMHLLFLVVSSSITLKTDTPTPPPPAPDAASPPNESIQQAATAMGKQSAIGFAPIPTSSEGLSKNGADPLEASHFPDPFGLAGEDFPLFPTGPEPDRKQDTPRQSPPFGNHLPRSLTTPQRNTVLKNTATETQSILYAMVRITNTTNWTLMYMAGWDNEPIENGKVVLINAGESHEFSNIFTEEEWAPSLIVVFNPEPNGMQHGVVATLEAGVSFDKKHAEKTAIFSIVEKNQTIHLSSPGHDIRQNSISRHALASGSHAQ